MAYLVAVTYPGGRPGHLLAFVEFLVLVLEGLFQALLLVLGTLGLERSQGPFVFDFCLQNGKAARVLISE